jgi:GH15 family glucan-1,4-alpha-glucosidase
MARSVTIGNGNVLVGLDRRGQVRDLYYPFVGEANHVSGASGNYVHRIGVFVDGQISWLDHQDWRVTIGCETEACVGSLFAENEKLGVTLASRDVVHNEQNVLVRHFTVTNTKTEKRTIKLFLSQQFRIFESRRGDTGFYDPRVRAIVHYKGEVTLLVNAIAEGKPFSEYNIGLFGIEGKQGTYLDAEDGTLENNPIEHGSVDSVVGLEFELDSAQSKDCYYWIACGKSVGEVHNIDKYVLDEGPDRIVSSTESYWRAWLEREDTDLSVLPEALRSLYERSLLIMRVHTDNRGGIIASSDTDMLHHGRDTYSYVWPRDAAIIAHTYTKTGYQGPAKRFFEFMQRCQDPAVEFIESLYNAYIEPAADFLTEYIEATTGLPQASFDLWEEKYGTSTYTSASVYAGLMAAAKFAMVLGKTEPSRTYQAVAERIRSAIGNVLFDTERGIFAKHVLHSDDGELEFDWTIDTSSLHGLLFFGVYDIDDERITRMAEAVDTHLQVHGDSKGYVRYENDNYYRLQEASSPNPWVICTLWVARYHIEKAQKHTDLKRPLELLEWTVSHATQSGVLAEQMQPDTREQLSASPLVWSHAEYVLTVKAYLDKLEQLEKTELDLGKK